VPSDRWIEIAVRVAPDNVDLVAGVLADLTGQAVAIEPEIRRIEDVDFGYEELDAPVAVRAYAEPPLSDASRASIEAALERLGEYAPLQAPTYRELDPADWSEEWKRFYDIQHVGSRLVVRPSWLEYQPTEDEVVVELDPGAAFGTGQHETTRLCLAAIERIVQPGGTVLDVGCGSGILAIAAAKLGAGHAIAVDVDPEAIRVTEENATINEVNSKIEAAVGSLGDLWPWPERPPRDVAVLIANISSGIVLRMLGAIGDALSPDGHAVLSGFLAKDAPEIEAAVRAAHLTVLGTATEGEWACLLAQRSATG
jgi:ribosomal protein L11 methyltransferase